MLPTVADQDPLRLLGPLRVRDTGSFWGWQGGAQSPSPGLAHDMLCGPGEVLTLSDSHDSHLHNE